MNNDDYVLDSNIVSAVLHGHPKLRERLTIIPAERIFLNIVSAFENLRGWFAQVNKQQSTNRIVWAFDGLQKTLAYYVRFAQPQTGASLVFGGKAKYYRLTTLQQQNMRNYAESIVALVEMIYASLRLHWCETLSL